MTKIRDIYRTPLVTYSNRMPSSDVPKFLKAFPSTFTNLVERIPPRDFSQILNIGAGVEIELENVRPSSINQLHDAYPEVSKAWETVADNSLRNHGLEFLTPVGDRVYNILTKLLAFTQASTKLGWQTSDRTSMHVHLNVNNITPEQVQAFTMLYTLLEEPLFSYVSPLRRNNIFCVSFRESLLASVSNSADDITTLISEAQKYCAFNMASIKVKGTVEFRQMDAPTDFHRPAIWLLLLSCIKRAATFIPFDDLKDEVFRLKYESEYERFLARIFYGLEGQLQWSPDSLDEAVSDCKLFFGESQ
jgi:hypothetical protein